MSQYFDSGKIKIYPSAKRDPQYNYPANLNTEQNIVSLSNNIVDIKNYIIDGLGVTVTSNKVAISAGKCVISGYSIEISSQQSVDEVTLNTNNNYYVYLTANMVTTSISQGSVQFNLPEINGIDSNQKYTGIDIEILTSEKLDTTNSVLLAKISRASNHWSIQNSAKNIKFDANKTTVSVYPNWGLSKTLVDNPSQEVYTNSLQNWLADDFIIDDGQIVE